MMVNDVQYLVNMNTGWVSPTLENSTRVRLRSVLTEFEAIHNSLCLSSVRCIRSVCCS